MTAAWWKRKIYGVTVKHRDDVALGVYNPFDRPIKKVYGPYIRSKDGRKMMIVHFLDGSKSGMSWARWKMVQKLRRPLDRWTEHVDHRNEDPLDDRLENLQVLTPQENARKSGTGRPSPQKGTEKGWQHGTLYGWQKRKCRCAICARHMEAYKVIRNAKRRKKNGGRGERGPYYVGELPPHGTTARYHRKCRCARCRSANAEAARRLRAKK